MFNFFIDRPVFSAVISLIISLAGGVAVLGLPITQYPQIVPPQVLVSTAFPGANATVVAQSIAAPIEQQVNGAKNMIYMDSKSANDGTYTLTVTFDVGTNQDLALVKLDPTGAPQLPFGTAGVASLSLAGNQSPIGAAQDPASGKVVVVGATQTSGEVVAATRRLAAEGLPTEVEDGVTCCHALQDKVWVSGADTRWEVYTVLADAPMSPTAAGAEGSCATEAASAAPCCAPAIT